jgi:hypothetical protein
MPRRRPRRGRPPLLANRANAIRAAYTRPGHSTAFSAPGNVAKAHNISYGRARKILEELDSYVTHREYKRPASFNPYFIYHRRELVQADLIDIGLISRYNRGVKYLLLIIDCFSRKVWVYPLLRKSAPAMVNALTTWLGEIGEPAPRVFSTDEGLEFRNRPVMALLRSRGVDPQVATGTCKAAIAERANKTIQIILYKYMTENQTRTYRDRLQELVASYNRRPHRSLANMTPNGADSPRNEVRVRGIHTQRYARVKRKRVRFKLGQVVRIKFESKALSRQSRAYGPQFKSELFVIRRINRRLPIPLYYLKSMNTDEAVKGGFYSNELTAARGDLFKIERILEERGEGANRQVLVRWMHFGPRWDLWIPAANVQRYRARRPGRGRPPNPRH